MELFDREDLKEYVRYWGGDLTVLESHPYKRGRGLAAVIFYCLHFPEEMPKRQSWARTVKQAVTFLWTWLHREGPQSDRIFRTTECREYFRELLSGYIKCYGEKTVFQFRYQNWFVVDCETMVDELWTILEMSKEAD